MYYLIIFSLLYFILLIFLRKKNIVFFKIILISSLVLYVIPILAFQYDKYKIEEEMKKFDLNQDGFYSSNEINADFYGLQKQLTSDTGSNFFILIGYPICLLYSILMVLLFKIFDYLSIEIQKIK